MMTGELLEEPKDGRTFGRRQQKVKARNGRMFYDFRSQNENLLGRAESWGRRYTRRRENNNDMRNTTATISFHASRFHLAP